MDIVELSHDLDVVESLLEAADSFQKSVHYSEDAFEEHLDNLEGELDICGITYPAGEALRKLDPIAFREQYLNTVDAMDKRDFQAFQRIVEELEDKALEVEDDYPEVAESIRSAAEEL